MEFFNESPMVILKVSCGTSKEFIKGHKNFQVIGVPNAAMQSKVAGHIYGKWRKEKGERNEEKGNPHRPVDSSAFEATAIVLGDENLLVPLMNSLDVPQDTFNITMGLALQLKQRINQRKKH